MMMPSVVSAERMALRRSERGPTRSCGRRNACRRAWSFDEHSQDGERPRLADRLDRGARFPGAHVLPSRFHPHAGSSIQIIVVEDQPIAHPDDTIGVGRDDRVMRHEHDREPILTVELAEEGENLLTRLRVEVTSRLIGDQQRAPVDESRAIATRCCSPPESRDGS